MIEFYVSEKFITVDEDTLPKKGMVGDNTKYIAHFNFDSEWDGLAKTARFYHGSLFKNMVLEDDTCEFPIEILKSGFVTVGVFGGNLTASTGVKIPMWASILQKDGLPADPTPDVYAQLMDAWGRMENTITIRTWTDADFENLDGGAE